MGPEATVRKLFGIFDTDNDQMLSKSEYLAYVRAIGEWGAAVTDTRAPMTSRDKGGYGGFMVYERARAVAPRT